MSRYSVSRSRGGGVTYRASDHRWIARVQIDGVRHTASHQGPNTPAGRLAAERMRRALVARATGSGPRPRRGQVWPIELLLRAAGIDAREVAGMLGLSERTGYRWVQQDVRLTSVEADTVATRLGLHPAMVWRDWE